MGILSAIGDWLSLVNAPKSDRLRININTYYYEKNNAGFWDAS